MTVAPLHEGKQRYAELAALASQSVLEAFRPLAVANAVEDALGHESIEAVCEDVAGHSESVLQLVEPVVPESDVANDQQRPAVADELERACDRADLPFIGALEHEIERTAVTCVKQPSRV